PRLTDSLFSLRTTLAHPGSSRLIRVKSAFPKEDKSDASDVIAASCRGRARGRHGSAGGMRPPAIRAAARVLDATGRGCSGTRVTTRLDTAGRPVRHVED